MYLLQMIVDFPSVYVRTNVF